MKIYHQGIIRLYSTKKSTVISAGLRKISWLEIGCGSQTFEDELDFDVNKLTQILP